MQRDEDRDREEGGKSDSVLQVEGWSRETRNCNQMNEKWESSVKKLNVLHSLQECMSPTEPETFRL